MSHHHTYYCVTSSYIHYYDKSGRLFALTYRLLCHIIIHTTMSHHHTYIIMIKAVHYSHSHIGREGKRERDRQTEKERVRKRRGKFYTHTRTHTHTYTHTHIHTYTRAYSSINLFYIILFSSILLCSLSMSPHFHFVPFFSFFFRLFYLLLSHICYFLLPFFSFYFFSFILFVVA